MNLTEPKAIKDAGVDWKAYENGDRCIIFFFQISNCCRKYLEIKF